MSEVIIESDDGDLFGENLIASFVCDVDYDYVPYEAESEYAPESGGYTDINSFTFDMVVHSSDGKNNLLGSFIRYESLDKNKQKEIHEWVAKRLASYFEEDEEDCNYEDDRDRYYVD